MGTKAYEEFIAEQIKNSEAQTKSLLEAEQSASDVTMVEKRAEAAGVGMIDLAGKAWTSGNRLQDLWAWGDRSLIPNDPTFNIDEHKDMYSDLPQNEWSRFNGVESRQEAQALRDDILKTQKDQEVLVNAGVRGMAVSMLVNIVDVDLPLTYFTGAGPKVAGVLAKAGMVGRSARILSMAAAGAEAGIISEGVGLAVGPTGTWRDIPSAGLSGLAFGGALGILGKTQAQINTVNAQAAKMRTEFAAKTQEPTPGPAPFTTHTAPPRPVQPEPDMVTPKEQGTQKVAPSVLVSQAEANLVDLNKSIQALDESLDKALNRGDTDKFNSLWATRKELKDAATAEQEIIDANKEVSNGVQLFGESTVGSAQVKTAPDSWTDLIDPVAIGNHARTILAFHDAKKIYGEVYTDSAMNQLARNLDKAVDASPVQTDFSRMWNSGSDTAKAFAVLQLEDASGRLRNNTSGAMLHDMYTNEIAAAPLLNIDAMYMKYAKIQNRGGAIGDLQMALNDTSKRLDFYKEVRLELEERLHGDPKGSPTANKAVKEMADHFDAGSKKALELSKGDANAGEIPVHGSENLEVTPGYFRTEWHGPSLTRALKLGATEEQIIQGLAMGYRKMHPTWEPDWYEKMARSIVRSAQTQLSGIDTNLLNLLQEEGLVYARQFIIDSGLSEQAADKMLKGLRDVSPDTQKAGSLRHKISIDLRDPIPGTNLQLVDLTNMDLPSVWSRYARKTGGIAAFARNGIQYGDRRPLIDTMQKEDPTLSSEFLEGVFDYFLGKPVAGGVNPWVQRPIRATNLSLLGSIALSQAAETSVGIASFGMKAYMSTLADVAKAHWNGDMTSTLKQVEPWLKIVHGEEHLMRPDLAIAEMNQSPGMFAEQGRFIDSMLAKGARIQSIISGFNALRRLQTNTVIHSMVGKLDTVFDKLAKLSVTAKSVEEFEAAASKVMNPKRLYDIGIDTALRDRLMKYWNNGTVQRVSNGEVNLNFDKWDASDVRELAAVLNRSAGLYVQRGFHGEGTVWFNKTEGAVLTNLKKFSLLAMQKQATRNMRIQDSESIGAFSYGLGVAGTVAMVRNVLNGRDNDDPMDITKQAFMMSNLTGWVPMWSDPITGMLGMDSLQFSKNYRQGLGGDIVGTPPVFTQTGKILHAPEAVASILTGNGTSDDVKAMRATPVIGNLIGTGVIYSAMLKDIKEDAAKEKLEMKQREIDYLESKKTSIFYEPSKEDDKRLKSLNKSMDKATGKEQSKSKTAIQKVQEM